ncbi:PH domain-containing protein [Namhaeicola litoreus]|uniref:PH domain-containing protein n=1 Tax=Namhaeicola litoreus TaxID=1052145 RepID=A0ABW3Y5I2_9FLAO
MKTEFKASLDLSSKILSALMIGFTIWLFYRIIVQMQNNGTDIRGQLIIFLILLAIILTSYLWHPKSYSLTDDALTINRAFKPIHLNFKEINSVNLPSNSDLYGTIRTFGVGGLFGYFGKFYNRKYGTMNWYVTQRKNRILIELKSGQKYMISPDDQNLIEKLQAKI